MALRRLPSVVTCAALKAELDASYRFSDVSKLRIVDATWYMPGTVAAERSAAQDFVTERITGAVFFDHDAPPFADTATKPGLGHMVPSDAQWGEAMNELGISAETQVVVYDRHGVFSAPRVWWLMQLFGQEKVAVLDGGLPQWRAANLPIERGGSPASYRGTVGAASWKAQREAGVCGLEQVLELDATEQFVDARPAARFTGEAPEPRPNCRGGRIAGSTSLVRALTACCIQHPPSLLLLCSLVLLTPESPRA